MIFTKHRFEIWEQGQHPYKHSLAEFSYSNPALPGVVNAEQAFAWILAVLYPNTKPAVANVAALPLVGNTINDFRVVEDDGDGKAASYRWEQREGDASPSWYKIYDMDWGSNSILEAFQLRTQDLYVFRRGYDDLDNSGAVVGGLYAGQVVTGGLAANSNLTLRANAGDGVGPRTGFVQVDDQFRPTVNNLFDIGTLSEKFKDIYLSGNAYINTLTFSSGSITDSTGSISFGNENLSTTGNLTGAVVKGTTSLVADVGGQQMTLTPGSIANTTGTISFGANALSTSGTLAAGVTTLTDNAQTLIFDPDVAGQARITSSTGTIGFDNEHLTTTGNITGATITGSLINVDNIQLDLNTISITNLNGNLNLSANGTGVVNVSSAMTTIGQTVTGTLGVTGIINIDNLRLDLNTISSTNTNGNIILSPNGSGLVQSMKNFVGSADVTNTLGTLANRWGGMYLSGLIQDGTNSISTATLMALRSSKFRDLAQTLPAQAGDSLFYDSVNSVWLASAPDTEITHSTISGLTTGDAGHTQFAMLAGRAGGQIIQGGTAASENLTLESTSNVTKGVVYTKDDFWPFTNASYSAGWSGTDLGDSTKYFRDVYTKGEHFGFRLENFTSISLPAASAQNVGRLVFTSDTFHVYGDTGTALRRLSLKKHDQDTSWNGTDVTKTVTVSSYVDDARNCSWQLRDNTNNFEIIYAKITTPNATDVVITTNVALPAGSYRLVGVE